MEGRWLEPPPLRDTLASGLGFAMSVFAADSSLLPCGGETGTEGPSVGEYALGVDIRAELWPSDSSRRGAEELGTEVLFAPLLLPSRGVLTTAASTMGSRLASILPSTMGVRARRVVSSGPKEPKPSGGI